jgi:DNA polymerase alpha subunit A
MKIRQHIAKYYLAWTVCDEDGCGARTRMMGVYGKRCLGLVKEGCKGNIRLEVSSFITIQMVLTDDQYSDLQLYNQLLFYRHLFDSEKALSSMRGSARYGKSSKQDGGANAEFP